jgi:hypothetical protein
MKRYTYRSVVRRGRKDGRDWEWKFWPFKAEKHREPKSDQTIPAQYETEILQMGLSKVSEIAEEWKELDKKLKPEYCKALAAYNHASQRYKKEKGEEKQASDEFETARQKYEAISPPALAAGWKRFWLILLGLGEFPINAMIFQILGQGQRETILFSALICVVIPLAAHWFGHGLRQDVRDKRDIWLMIAGPVILLAVLTMIALMRAKYFEAVETHQLLGLTVTPTEGTIFFLVINLMVYFVALVISYQGSHPNHKLYTEVNQRYKEALERLTKEAGEAKRAGEELKQAEMLYQEIRQRREKSHQRLIEQARTIQEGVEWLASAYRASNLSVRPDVPDCFKKPLNDIVLPASFSGLDWECAGELPKEAEEVRQ